jgi:hypothetical protein
MQLRNLAIETVTSAGGTYTVDVETLTDGLYIVPNSPPLTLVANIAVNFSGTPSDQQVILVGWGHYDLNGNTITINGISLTDTQALSAGSYEFTYISGTWLSAYFVNLNNVDQVDANVLTDNSLTLSKLGKQSAGKVLMWNATTDPTATAITGDVTVTSSGVTAIAAGVIVNADVNASAAIALSKLAALTASKVAVTDGSGIIATANQLTPALGGTGQDLSAATGFVTVSAGTVSAGAISDVITLDVSFETGELGDFKVSIPYACTVTEIYAYAYKAIAATDNGTIVPKNNGGTTMTAGTITFTASDARGTAYTSSPSANNTFSAGDLLTLTTAKTTAGGKVLVSIKVTRTL